MDTREFSLIRTFECMTDARGLRLGDKFLTGTRMIEQIDNKEEGQTVTYYEVINADSTGNNIEYATRYIVLEAPPVEDRRNKL